MSARGTRPGSAATPESDIDLLDGFRSTVSSFVESLGLGWGLFLGLVVPTLVVAVVVMILAVWLWRRSRRTSSNLGMGHFAGQIVTVESAEGRHGQAFVEGSWWSLHSSGEPLQAGAQVRVRSVEGLFLVVEPLSAEAPKEEDT